MNRVPTLTFKNIGIPLPLITKCPPSVRRWSYRLFTKQRQSVLGNIDLLKEFAGKAGTRGGLHELLHVLLTMRDDGAFAVGQDWLHVLGVSQLKWSVLLSAVQRGLRARNPNIRVSFDSASPFQAGARYEKVVHTPILSEKLNDWSFKSTTLPSTLHYSEPALDAPFPDPSPIGNLLKMHHLVIDREPMKSRRLDHFSNLFLVNHALWIYIDAFRRANELIANEPKNAPHQLVEACTAVEDILQQTSWKHLLDRYKPLFDAVAPVQR